MTPHVIYSEQENSHHIYFDGYLPLRKRDIRLQRLENNRRELLTFQARNPEKLFISPGTNEIPQTAATASQLLVGALPPSAPYRGNPTAPFLVACVIEELLRSEYASVTNVVYWEADVFCAAAARLAVPGAVILMNDSDLLVHDLGRDGSAAFLNQIELYVDKGEMRLSDTCQILRVPLFQTSQMAQRFGLTDMKRLAFEVKIHPSTTLTEAIRKVGSPPSDAYALAVFVAEYAAEPWETIFGETSRSKYIPFHLRRSVLDPRISELVLQMHYHPLEESVKVYLPVLIEDPTRATAWSSAMEARLLAYSCIQCYSSAKASRRSIWEVFRKGDRVASTEMQLMDKAQIVAHASKLSASIQAHKQHAGDHSAWRRYATSCAYTREMTDQDWINMVKGGPNTKSWSWNDVHNQARVEAVLYSLRIVQQVLHNLVLMNTPLPGPVLELDQVLAVLPALKVMMATG